MTRLTMFDALTTLANEPCYVVRGMLKVKSDGRLVYRKAATLVDAGFIEDDGRVTPWLQSQIVLHPIRFKTGG